MAGGYRHRPTGEQAHVQTIKNLRAQVAAARRQVTNAGSHSPFAVAAIPRVKTLIPVQDGTVGAIALSEAVAVPDGFTAATLMLTVALDALRDASASSGATLSIQAFADSVQQDVLTRTFAAANSQAQVTHTLSATLAGLSGSFNVGASGWGSATGWVADSGICHMSALVIFLR